MGITDKSRQQSIARQKAKQVIQQAEVKVEHAKSKEEIRSAIDLMKQQADELKFEDEAAYRQVCENIAKVSRKL